jgi:hypothetical protein
MTPNEKCSMADLIQSAFYDGYNSYTCDSFSTVSIGQAWLASPAYRMYTRLYQEANQERRTLHGKR